MSEKNTQNKERPFYLKLEWYLEKFSPAVIVIIVAVITTITEKKFNWMWVVALCVYFLVVIAAVITSACVTAHYNKMHGNPKECQSALDAHCKKIDDMHCKYSKECKDTIGKMNGKVEEQKEYFKKVDRLVDNAKQLEKMYAEAVTKRLRTNKQIADIEARVKSDSIIYIMTTSFLFERFDEDLRKSIASNLMRNIRYCYIIPINKEREFEKMVYAVMAEMQRSNEFQDESILDNSNEILKAVQIPQEYCMLTIAYYELDEPDLSSVIVKLPADTLDEVNEQEALTYLVPSGEPRGRNGNRYNSDHKIFLESMSAIYRNNKTNANGEDLELAFTLEKLKNDFKNGVEISEYGSDRIKLE